MCMYVCREALMNQNGCFLNIFQTTLDAPRFEQSCCRLFKKTVEKVSKCGKNVQFTPNFRSHLQKIHCNFRLRMPLLSSLPIFQSNVTVCKEGAECTGTEKSHFRSRAMWEVLVSVTASKIEMLGGQPDQIHQFYIETITSLSFRCN